MIKHIIWDWNGTLLDDRWLCIEAINQLLAERKLPLLSQERYLEIFDFPVKDYYERAGFDFTKEPFEDPAMEFISIYRSRKLECTLHEGAGSVILDLASRGYQQSLLSASEEELLLEMIRHFGIAERLFPITGLDNHFASGKMELARTHLAKLAFSSDEIMMIGDTCHDHQVADMLGISCILFTGGHFPSSRLMACNGLLANHLTEIPDLLRTCHPL